MYIIYNCMTLAYATQVKKVLYTSARFDTQLAYFIK